MYARTSFGPEKRPNHVNFFTRMISTLIYKWPPGEILDVMQAEKEYMGP